MEKNKQNLLPYFVGSNFSHDDSKASAFIISYPASFWTATALQMSEVNEERAVLFSRPGHERIDQLEAKRRSYQELADTLSVLPQKVRHPGLIPVGPRLFLPGTLVHTNEVTVLLGRSGDASYFAERSAHQALGIVQRRLGIVDANIANVEVGKKEVEDAVAHQQSRQKNLSEGKVKSALPKQIVKAEPVDLTTQQNKVSKPRKRVSFNEPLVVGPTPYLERSEKPVQHDSNSAKSTKSIPVVDSSSNSKPVSWQSKESESEKTAASQNVIEESPREVLSQFKSALKAAQVQVKEDGVVNITEFYADDSEDPTHVELSPGFEPDKSVSFEKDSGDYLDITGTTKSGTEKATATREDYWSALLEAEADAEAEQAREESEEKEVLLQREQKEFGSGFSKGFFGAPASAKRTKASASKSDVRNDESVVAAVEEKVVERRPSRKSRSNRKQKAHAGLSALALEGDNEAIEQSSGNAALSKFRQLRNSQRNIQSEEK